MNANFTPFETSLKNFENKFAYFGTFFVNFVRYTFRPGAEAFLRKDKISKKSSKEKQLILNFFTSRGSGGRPSKLPNGMS